MDSTGGLNFHDAISQWLKDSIAFKATSRPVSIRFRLTPGNFKHRREHAFFHFTSIPGVETLLKESILEEQAQCIIMSSWIHRLFDERADLFLKLMDQRWARTEELVDGIVKVLASHGISSGNLLDLCCGNGRVSIHMAKKGFRTMGVDISRAFLKDASRKAEHYGVSSKVVFREGDVRKLSEIVGKQLKPFDIVVSVWTSIGFFPETEDLSIFKQARELAREGAILFVAETMHTEYLSIKFAPTSYTELGDMIMLENRKYDPINARANTNWIFYQKSGENLEFIDKIEIEHHVYSLAELSNLLRKAGWETIASYGNLSTLQPMTPLTSMNTVARAT